MQNGARLGPYEVIGRIGAGGMGEVYKATDTRLDRTVAIKIISSLVAGDPGLIARFEREARTISQLQHPHICTLYDVGEVDGTHFLVLEYLEGETLAARLERGALPVSENLKLSGEIADALNKAHRSGIIHRDLKPGNVMLTRAGAKLLDFGLAKVTSTSEAISTLTAAPTQTTPLTSQGTLLGTFQYMAPEQLEGQEADARSDIWAFGCVLYEMLTGRRAFQGKSHAGLMSAILKDDPASASSVQAAVPPAIDRVIATCLAKDPDERFQTAHDLLLQLRWLAEGGQRAAPTAAVLAQPKDRSRLPWIASAVLALVAVVAAPVAILHLRERAAPSLPIEFEVRPPEGSSFVGVTPQFAVSPDGRRLVFVASSKNTPMLWVRSLDSSTARLLSGTEGSTFPFWSPDSKSVGFFALGKLKTMQIAGGPAMVVTDAPLGRGGTWNQDNVIVFSLAGFAPLKSVKADGGQAVEVTDLNAPAEASHRFPQFLPDGRHFLYWAGFGSSPSTIRIGSLDSKETISVGPSDVGATYAGGYLFYATGGALLAQPFDAAGLRKTGDPFPITNPISTDEGVLYGSFSASPAGVVAFSRGNASSRYLTWLDRRGNILGTVGEPGNYLQVRLSPDERRIAVSLTTGSTRDIWLVDARGSSTQFTFGPTVNSFPQWSLDGTAVYFSSTRSGPYQLYRKSANGGGQEELVVKLEGSSQGTDVTRDGKFLVYTHASRPSSNDVMTLSLTDLKPSPFLTTPANEDNGAFSPDGRWIAYQSDESGGRDEVYIRRFPAPEGAGKYRVSRAGGRDPRWRGDGKELYFLSPNGTMMAVEVTLEPEVQASDPGGLFPHTVTTTQRGGYDVSRDGKKFLFPMPDQRSPAAPITVVVNWPATLQK